MLTGRNRTTKQRGLTLSNALAEHLPEEVADEDDENGVGEGETVADGGHRVRRARDIGSGGRGRRRRRRRRLIVHTR